MVVVFLLLFFSNWPPWWETPFSVAWAGGSEESLFGDFPPDSLTELRSSHLACFLATVRGLVGHLVTSKGSLLFLLLVSEPSDVHGHPAALIFPFLITFPSDLFVRHMLLLPGEHSTLIVRREKMCAYLQNELLFSTHSRLSGEAMGPVPFLPFLSAHVNKRAQT